jgi:hypothetical protein
MVRRAERIFLLVNLLKPRKIKGVANIFSVMDKKARSILVLLTFISYISISNNKIIGRITPKTKRKNF